jgi:glutamyl-tRNA synthetase/glutamyl-Q tRNA(Asp) synthetase
MARGQNGQVLLRIEDHDRQRSRPEYEAAILDDLDWLGFRPDIYPTDGFRRGPCDGRQSDRGEVYRRALGPLVEQGRVYGCDCTRKQLDGARHTGRCRERGLPLVEGIGWRLRFDDPAADVLIRDRLGNWTYQWCVSVDDTEQQITHVIRGEDLRDSTERQIALARLLGREQPPAFVHHALIMKSPTQKLSKSDGDTGVRELRALGWTAPSVIGHAAAAVGLLDAVALVAADTVQRFFVQAPA